jgi:hypothetical protein
MHMVLCTFWCMVLMNDIPCVGSVPAGTDANVSCVLHGELGITPSLRLDSSANNFERGQRDEFSVMSADVGRFTQLTIGHDNK